MELGPICMDVSLTPEMAISRNGHLCTEISSKIIAIVKGQIISKANCQAVGTTEKYQVSFGSC